MPKAQGPPDLPHDLPDYQRGVIEELRAGPALVTSTDVMRAFGISRPQAIELIRDELVDVGAFKDGYWRIPSKALADLVERRWRETVAAHGRGESAA